MKNIVARLLLICSMVAISAWADVQYIYDPAGHLAEVVNTDGTNAIYQYDGAGNVLYIANVPTMLLMATFSPDRGQVGSTVTIYGNSFSTTPANNTVQFNGTAATVSTATATTLTVTVPAGATTGPVSVTVAGNTVTSITPFTVLTGVSISGFTPASGVSGTSVTINGTGFDSNTIVTFNGVASTPTNVTSTSLTVPVPANCSTGPIKVSNLNGSAVSATNFIVPPAGISAGSISSVSTITTNSGPQNFTNVPANNDTFLLVPGSDGNLYSLQFSSLSPSNQSLSYSIYAPNSNAVVASGSITSSALSLHLPALNLPGYYTVALSSTAQTSYSVVLEAAPILTVGNTTPYSGSITVAGQTKRLAFQLSAGQYYGFGITAVSGSAPLAYALYDSNGFSPYYYNILFPWGGNSPSSESGSCNSDGSGSCELNFGPAPVSGIYSTIVNGNGNGTVNYNFYISQITSQALTLGQSYDAPAKLPGQSYVFTFSGITGQHLALDMTNIAMTLGSKLQAWIIDPDGSSILLQGNLWIFPNSQWAGPANIVPLAQLPQTGTYTLYIRPNYRQADTGTFTVMVDPGSQNISSGVAVPGAIGSLQSGAFFTFQATASSPYNINLSNLSVPGSNSLNYYVYDPGLYIQNSTTTCTSNGTGCQFSITSASTTGIYAIVAVAGSGTTSCPTCTFNVTLPNGSTPNTISVTAHAPSTAQAYGSSFNVAATASATPVVITSSGGCSGGGIGSATITMTSGTTSCTVSYNQSGNATYAAATQVQDTTPASLANQSITVLQPAPSSAAALSTFNVAASASSGLAVSITSSGGCSGSGTSTATIGMTSSTVACVVSYNVAATTNYAAASQVQSTTSATYANQQITVTTSAPATAIYNNTFNVAAFSSSGLGVTISTTGGCSGSGSSGTATITMTSGTTACTINYNQGGDSNYNAAAQIQNTTSAVKATAGVVLSNLLQTYTGSALTPTATTTPAGLTIYWTNAPQTNVGTYSVTATISDPNYQGLSTDNFVIN